MARFGSVWVVDGHDQVHHCAPYDPLASPQGFLLAHVPGDSTCQQYVLTNPRCATCELSITSL